MYDFIISNLYNLLMFFTQALNEVIGLSVSFTLESDVAIILLFFAYVFVMYWFIRLTVAVIRWFYRI